MDEYNSNNYNIDNISDNYEENNINNYSNDNNNRNSNSNSVENINRIFEENEKRNRIKIDTTEFMSYSIKVELLFQTLQGYLYWISAGEILIFLTLFFMFCFSPKIMAKIWWYIFHFFRGFFGFGIIYYLPKTYELIENLKDIPDVLENLKYSLIQSFFALLKPPSHPERHPKTWGSSKWLTLPTSQMAFFNPLVRLQGSCRTLRHFKLRSMP